MTPSAVTTAKVARALAAAATGAAATPPAAAEVAPEAEEAEGVAASIDVGGTAELEAALAAAPAAYAEAPRASETREVSLSGVLAATAERREAESYRGAPSLAAERKKGFPERRRGQRGRDPRRRITQEQEGGKGPRCLDASLFCRGAAANLARTEGTRSRRRAGRDRRARKGGSEEGGGAGRPVARRGQPLPRAPDFDQNCARPTVAFCALRFSS